MAALSFAAPKLVSPFANMLAALTQRGRGVWVVGGWVRDQARGARPHDADFCTNAEADEIEAAARAAGVVVLLDRVAQMHGTYRLAARGEVLDLARLRQDVARVGARHAEVRFAEALAEDLARRDLTINALALPFPLPPDPAAALVDLHGGVADLAARRLRLIGEPDRRLEEDPLRLLRVARFACMGADWCVEAATTAAMGRCAPLVATVSSERRLAELMRALALPCPQRFWQLAEASGAWASLLPPEASAEARARATDALEAVAPHLEAPMARLASFVLAGVGCGNQAAAAAWLAPLRFPRVWQQAVATVVGGALPPEAQLDDAPLVRWALTLGPRGAEALHAWATGAAEAAPLVAVATSSLRALARVEALRQGRELWRPQHLALDAEALFDALDLPPGAARTTVLHMLLVHVWLHPADNAPERLLALARERADAPG